MVSTPHRQKRFLFGVTISGETILGPPEIQAGMPSFTINDVVHMRLEDISFFLFVLLIITFLVRGIWNSLARDFDFLPLLKFRQAYGLSVLFGIGMLLVLTMISGIREVLTPKAWRKQGSTYRLNAPAQEESRRRSVQHLRASLMTYATGHNGHFPKHDYSHEIPEKIWETPSPNGTRYVYRGGLTTNEPPRWIAWEPSSFGEERYGLMTDGHIGLVSATVLNEPK